ncbi:hypothetical protein [Oscillospiraceae bacterium]|jgi:hypothetical protein|nr:hypothetical protein [Oscillospiraceae bacterium]
MGSYLKRGGTKKREILRSGALRQIFVCFAQLVNEKFERTDKNQKSAGTALQFRKSVLQCDQQIINDGLTKERSKKKWII